MLEEFAELFEKKWRKNQLRWIYKQPWLKALNNKAERLHNMMEAISTEEGSFFHLHTKIIGNEKRGYELHVAMTRYEKRKRKRNTHIQKTDI